MRDQVVFTRYWDVKSCQGGLAVLMTRIANIATLAVFALASVGDIPFQCCSPLWDWAVLSQPSIRSLSSVCSSRSRSGSSAGSRWWPFYTSLVSGSRCGVFFAQKTSSVVVCVEARLFSCIRLFSLWSPDPVCWGRMWAHSLQRIIWLHFL